MNNDIEQIEKKSRIQYEAIDALAKENNSYSIHFEPRDPNSRAQFSILLRRELMLRNLNPSGSIEDRRFRLRESLDRELLISELKNAIEHCKPQESALYTIICAIPCILHAENRMGLKFIWLILDEGVTNVKRKLIPGCQEINGEKKRIDLFIVQIEEIVNTKILGSQVHGNVHVIRIMVPF